MTQTYSSYKQLFRFIIVGCSAVVTDLASYTTLVSWFEWNFALAKAVSFILGTIVAFIFNKYWTFEKPGYRHTEIIKFITLYSLTLGANVIVNHYSLWLFPSFILLAFLAATGTSTVLNFVGQKWWVFKEHGANSNTETFHR